MEHRWGSRLAALVATSAMAAAFLFWPEAEHAIDGAGDERPALAGAPAASQLYSCGMHPQVITDEPGSCPICSMPLTPVGRGDQAAGPGGEAAEREVLYWRAPMDPTYVSVRPGKSPMGMDLIPVYDDEADEDVRAAVTISPVVVQNMGVRTATVDRRPLLRTVRTVGTVDYDEPLVKDVTTKFDGWIEELFADYTGQPIEAGMPLFSVYSRELYSSQEEYLLALRNRRAIPTGDFPDAARDMRDLVESARLRLKLFDISDDQIAEIERRGTPSRALVIHSPHSGVIVEKVAREGMHVTPGMKLYTIADLSRVWVYVDIYENEVPFVKLGQEASMELSYLPGQTFHGKVVYVYPFVTTETRTVKVRLEFDNPHLLLKPGMFADVRIRADLGRSGVTVPRSAIIDTGERKVAFVSTGKGRFEPRPVRLGVELGEDRVEILEGLAQGEPVVTSGQFLLDSESKLREAVAKMMERRRTGSPVETAMGATGESEAVPSAHSPYTAAEPGALVPGAGRELAPAIAGVVDAYLTLQERLARGDEASAAQAVTALLRPLADLGREAGDQDSDASRAVEARTMAAKEAVQRMVGRSIDAIRAQFGDLSAEVIALYRLSGPDEIAGDLHVLRCPMAGGDWIQRGTEPLNPYYGFAMLRCGETVEPPETVR